jgi:hypothetical protein
MKVAIGFFLFSLRSFENKNIIFAWLYALLKLCLKGFQKGFPFAHRYWLCQ